MDYLQRTDSHSRQPASQPNKKRTNQQIYSHYVLAAIERGDTIFYWLIMRILFMHWTRPNI